MSKWLEEVKKRADVWEPAEGSDGTSSISFENYCTQGITTVEIPKNDFDRLIAIAEEARRIMEGPVEAKTRIEEWEKMSELLNSDKWTPP